MADYHKFDPATDPVVRNGNSLTCALLNNFLSAPGAVTQTDFSNQIITKAEL